jgi:alpha-ketoglutaric semialdehyde dehydrogenase
MKLQGNSFIQGASHKGDGSSFYATNPATGEKLEAQFVSATQEDVVLAAEAAENAFGIFSEISSSARAVFLRTIATGLEEAADELIDRAHLETALPRVRLTGEVQRTSNQLRLFADVVEEGSWTRACIDTALPERKPIPRPDIRSMLRPLGPVAVFGASNFPLAFSVAGGDTASAFAAGNPVIVKAHPAHPGTSEIAGRVIVESVASCGLPPGVFSLLFDAGIEVGRSLVQHPLIKAVGFTGSHAAGRALMKLAAERPHPIPCFTEMSSTNPVFILPGALSERGAQIASGLHGSFTLGAGQFCTKPGLVFLPQHEQAIVLVRELRELATGTAAFTMLTSNIAATYSNALSKRKADNRVRSNADSAALGPYGTKTEISEIDVDTFHGEPEFGEEIFGPSMLVVHCGERAAMMQAAEALQGQLTATLFGTDLDLEEYRDLIQVLERKAGRVLINGFPTGVEVSHAMVHGGPYPATSDSRFTSVGSQSMLRFARPVCYQGFPQLLLPPELQDKNPLGIFRMIDGSLTRDPL